MVRSAQGKQSVRKSGSGDGLVPHTRRRGLDKIDPQAGHEQAGRRPALVVSATAYNVKVGLALCCPITNQIKGFPFEVALPRGLPVTGAVLADQIKSMDWQARDAQYLCTLPEIVVKQVQAKIDALLKT